MKFSSHIQAIKTIISEQLPGEEAHAPLMPLNRPFSSQLKPNAEKFRQSAVALVLYENKGTMKSLLIQRPEYSGAHSRQISLPGGKKDLTDPNIEFTARRECMEEVAIPMDQLELIGKLSDVFIPVSKFIVSPHIFFVEKLPQLIPDPREVEEIIPFEVEALLSESTLRRTDIQFQNGLTQKNVPYFSIEERVVWGATGMILSEFRTILQKIV